QHGGIVAFVDVDHGFIPEYARRLGCRVEEIFIAQPGDGPMALEIVDALVRFGAFDLVALDSVPALYSRARADSITDGCGQAPARARLLSEAMRRLAANIDRTRTVVLFGNRHADRPSASGGEEHATPGGRALRFYSSVRVALQWRERLSGPVGIF